MSDDSGEEEIVEAGRQVGRVGTGIVATAVDLPVVMARLGDVAMEPGIQNEISTALAV